MSPNETTDGLGSKPAAPCSSSPGKSVTTALQDATSSMNHRGGRIDFEPATDPVDQASQESFPASDAPAWTLLDIHGNQP